jgi:L-ascorbate metabolism protein UlaG (beta-lactamase superfamily)
MHEHRIRESKKFFRRIINMKKHRKITAGGAVVVTIEIAGGSIAHVGDGAYSVIFGELCSLLPASISKAFKGEL